MAGTRSPNYPALGLAEAIQLAEKLYRNERRSSMDPAVIARAMDYNALHGPARSRISALRKYGLIEPTRGGFRLTDAAMTILFPPTESERREALREAAFRPELFRTMASEPGASDANLLGKLVRLGFTDAGAKAAIAAYRDTFSLVEPEEASYGPVETEDHDVIDTPLKPDKTDRFDPSFRGHVGGGPSGPDLSFRLPDGIVAVIQFKGGSPTSRAFDMLLRYLDLAKESVSMDETATAVSLRDPSAPPPPDERSLSSSQD